MPINSLSTPYSATPYSLFPDPLFPVPYSSIFIRIKKILIFPLWGLKVECQTLTMAAS
ncbi:MAG: hypothetical protein F6K63_27500 [Moorea sp. SIO1G6]|uniref:hypothetical protein n=1 Tax=Moorena TaxID=1155738 RepID=UPI000312C8C0|nr:MULTISPECIES: hypothetical protein [Moorena]NEP33397.1 hypothetical protein [Moorena sp. SIO3B2]NET67928.1 hypothetical protein [Moorena sp. SIO1G6]